MASWEIKGWVQTDSIWNNNKNPWIADFQFWLFFFFTKENHLITYKYNSVSIHTETETEKVAQWLT